MAGTLGMKGMRFDDFCYIVEENLVYNNTFFGGESHHIEMVLKNSGANSCANARVNNNVIANNILYKSWGLTNDVGNRAGELLLFLYDASAEANWIEPDQRDPHVSPSSTNWGGNQFFNNCMRKDGYDADWGQTIIYVQDSDYGGQYTFSIADIHNDDPIAWQNNIGDIPQLFSENPDAYGTGWWHLSPTSPCVDRGRIIDDYNGAHVESLFPGEGWGNLTYLGTAPDIGAHESDGSNPAPLSAPNQNRLQPAPR